MIGDQESKVAREHWCIDLFLSIFALGFSIAGSLGEAFITVCVCWMAHLGNKIVLEGRLAMARAADVQARKVLAAQRAREKEALLLAQQRAASEKYFDISAET